VVRILSIHILDAHELAAKVLQEEISAKDVVSFFLERISKINPALNAFVYANEASALSQASQVDVRKRQGEKMPLAGVPIAVKDVISVKDYQITCGSKILRGYIAPYDATVVERLKKAGAIIIGITNTDEFAMGSSTENSAYGPTHNPWSCTRVPGGSSGGSAVAVASGLSPVALGTDTGGSVRLPAAFTGVFGLKPTYGAVSRYGLIAYSNSLEQIGVFARSVKDLALVYSVISGADTRDGTTQNFGWDLFSCMGNSIENWKIGIVKETLAEGVDVSVQDALRDCSSYLERLGASVEEVSIKHIPFSLAAYYLIAMSEASSNLARFDGVRYGEHTSFEEEWNVEFSKVRSLFGLEVKRRILLGAYSLSAGYYEMFYEKAARFRSLISEEFKEAFKQFDVLLTPTSPTPPFRLGEKLQDPLMMYLSDIHTVPVNLAGLPALNLPVKIVQHDGELLPVGVQAIAPYGRDDKLFTLASALEKSAFIKKRIVEPWGRIVWTN
jgi:aspartyl-tRNA(Asn)/glutamyl-tRNA(Gln) amidotransferase subunit A